MNAKRGSQSLASFAIFCLVLLAGTIGLVAGTVEDGTGADGAISTCESGAEAGTCNSNDDTVDDDIVFAPLLEKPTEFVASSRPEIRLAVRRWIPEGEVTSLLVVHHGGCGWHSGWYDELGTRLKADGIGVIAYDQVGSGHSDGIGGRRQYFDSFDRVSDDLTKFVKDTREKYPGKKVFVLGESFGGMVAFHSILREQTSKGVADGYIMAGPVITLRPEMLPPKLVIKIVTFLCRFFPKLKMPGTDLYSTFGDAFGDQRWAHAGRADPFIQEAFVTPPLLDMAVSTLTASARNKQSMEKVEVPLFVLVGGDDVRIHIPESEKLVALAQSTDKRLKIIDKGRHLLFQDTREITKEVINDVKDWILARSTSA